MSRFSYFIQNPHLLCNAKSDWWLLLKKVVFSLSLFLLPRKVNLILSTCEKANIYYTSMSKKLMLQKIIHFEGFYFSLGKMVEIKKIKRSVCVYWKRMLFIHMILGWITSSTFRWIYFICQFSLGQYSYGLFWNLIKLWKGAKIL